MNYSALAGNPLHSRDDMKRAVVALCEPIRPHLSPGRARVSLGCHTAHFSNTSQEMEGFCRLLWGLAPLLAGEGKYDTSYLLKGLANGVDPQHPEFWGLLQDYDQRIVEIAAVAYALLLAPETFWLPLTPLQRTHLSTILLGLNNCAVYDNNWVFFRVLANLALSTVGEPYHRGAMEADLARIDSFYLGDGWYTDGPGARCDYYTAFAMHFYSLLFYKYAKGNGDVASRFRERAQQFAEQYIHWFADDGPSLPYGRSLTYRFAQAAFWGALAFCDIPFLSWGVLKGLILRHLRWWFRKPIFSESGLLTVGYGYPNLVMAEKYNSLCSPYWALKAFTPLALPEDHPFWTAREEAMPDVPAKTVQRRPKLILCRAEGHVFALAGGPPAPSKHKHAGEKYAKFCYSTRYGFSVPTAQRSLASGAHDSMLALSTDGKYFRVRTCSRRVEIVQDVLVAQWNPWADVEITTWLIPAGGWHVRVHRLCTKRRLMGAEGGFALGLDPEMRKATIFPTEAQTAVAGVQTGSGISLVWTLHGRRRAYAVTTDPNTNLVNPRTVIPTLLSRHSPGTHWLACAVFAGRADHARMAVIPESVPRFCWNDGGFTVLSPDGRTLFAQPLSGENAASEPLPDRSILVTESPLFARIAGEPTWPETSFTLG